MHQRNRDYVYGHIPTVFPVEMGDLELEGASPLDVLVVHSLLGTGIEVAQYAAGSSKDAAQWSHMGTLFRKQNSRTLEVAWWVLQTTELDDTHEVSLGVFYKETRRKGGARVGLLKQHTPRGKYDIATFHEAMPGLLAKKYDHLANVCGSLGSCCAAVCAPCSSAPSERVFCSKLVLEVLQLTGRFPADQSSERTPADIITWSNMGDAPCPWV
jgi:hypothetical protein